MSIPFPLRSLRSKSGNAAIEFAFIAPLLVLLLSGIVEIGLAVRTNYALQEALLSGANEASHKGWDVAAIRTAIQSSSPALKLTTTQITVTRSCGCPSETTIALIAPCDADPAAPGTCPASCTTICTSDNLAARKYAKLTATAPRQSIFGRSFGLSPNISATATTRVQ